MQRSVSATTDWHDAVVYQVFVRSFRDGNDDGVGDFEGLIEQLDTLVDLGVTALWLNPIFPSPTHHNYFATDLFDTDPEYGTLEAFARLCRAAHARGLRLLIDMETQYLPTEHRLFREAHHNPDSSHSDWFLWRGENNTDPVHLSMQFGLDGPSYDITEAITLNLVNPAVKAFQERIYTYWLDPLGTGDRNSGVDGFRMDHIMDDLDNQGVLEGLCASVWRPLIEATKRHEPDLFFLAEPADWETYGADLLDRTGMDGAFAMPLMFALRSLDKAGIREAVAAMLSELPEGKLPFTLLENHDVSRLATAVREPLGLGDEEPAPPGALRVAAAMLITLPGVPTLYYGQELGMLGQVGITPSDHHIPAREAFKWSADPAAPGMAVWYRDRAFWPHSRLGEPDPEPMSAQLADPGSLWHLYRRLIALRRENVALRRGDIVELACDNDRVLAYARRYRDDGQHEVVAVAVNLSDAPARTELDNAALADFPGRARTLLLGDAEGRTTGDAAMSGTIELKPWEVRIVRLG